MWRKQSEGKPSPSSPGSFDTPSYAPPVSSTSSSAFSPSSTRSSSGSVPSPEASLLTRGICIKGDLTGKGELTIDGEIIGSVRLGDSRIAVGANGRVKADIEARDVSVQGNVEGNLRGRERVLLGATSRVNGNIDSARVVVEEGAQFRGRVEMGRGADSRAERETAKKPTPSFAVPSPVSASPKASTIVPVTPASSSAASPSQEKGSIILPAPVGAPGSSR